MKFYRRIEPIKAMT
ncbi:HAD hydrolase, IA, variant 1 family protein, partial [Vibrio parahaemolyticus VPTS-2010_2]